MLGCIMCYSTYGWLYTHHIALKWAVLKLSGGEVVLNNDLDGLIWTNFRNSYKPMNSWNDKPCIIAYYSHKNAW